MKQSLAALTLSLYGCAVPVADQFEGPVNKESVVNGYEGAAEDFPAIGAFTYEDGAIAVCTVSLLRKDLALTAAHCINPDHSNPDGLGEYDPEFILHGRDEVFLDDCVKEECDKHLYRVAAAARHPLYDDSSDTKNHHDLALLLLEREIPAAQPIGLLPKAQFEEALGVGDTVTIAGYGGHFEGLFIETTYGKLYVADVPVTGYHNEAEIIVGEKDATKGNGCYGDSGGPVYVYSQGKVQLTGVASRLPEKIDGVYQCGYGVIYGLPTLETAWIESEYGRLRKEYPLIASGENTEPPLEVSGGASCQFSPTSSDSSFLPLLLAGYLLRRRRK